MSLQFVIILALLFRVTLLIQQIFSSVLINFSPMGNAMRAIPSHGSPIPMDTPDSRFKKKKANSVDLLK